MNGKLARRDVMVSSGAFIGSLALGGCSALQPRLGQTAPKLAPIRASADRIMRITVCTRPFRAEGPRLDVERIGNKIVVHNYGHGGSGWSLSWGSSTIAARKALATGATDVAVIGCGALGLTSATVLQRAGAIVTIYAKDRPPDVRSSLATGLWTPDSRICLDGEATPDFKRLWEEMARISYQRYQSFLGLADDPIEWIDSYHLAADRPARPVSDAPKSEIKFAELEREMIPDLLSGWTPMEAEMNPFPGHRVRRTSTMMFNLTAYSRLLISDFLANGGHIEAREFHSPADFSSLRQTTLINATGFGAKALFGDESLVPVRGQLTRLIPQPEVHYGLFYDGVLVVPRRDGLVLQAVDGGESEGFGDDTTIPDRGEAERSVAIIGDLFGKIPNA
jgi:glycine/D-amino acid oxidase-like deaminating enzyme